jgi:hypothetical protein
VKAAPPKRTDVVTVRLPRALFTELKLAHNRELVTVRVPRALFIELKLAYIRERWFSDGSLDEFLLSHPRIRWAVNDSEILDKLRADRERYEQRADPTQQGQIQKLWRFHEAANYGPALSTSWKRTRRARLFNALLKIRSSLEPPPGFPLPDLTKATRAMSAILKAAEKDDQFLSDADIAAKFRKKRSPVNGFLAEYSWVMLGEQPVLTFGELHKILRHWIERDDLRKRIKTLRKRYGELVVPLKPGKPGRPRKNRG